MSTYVDRYLRGECLQVWAELQEADAAVHDQPLYQDAWAVALETMKRVRYNLELLVPRLEQRGFQFGQGFFGTLSDDDRKRMSEIAPVLAAPTADVPDRLAAMEEVIGQLPLSVRAFYAVVGGVNFVGNLPDWQRLQPQGVEAPATFARDHPEFDWRRYSLDHGLDPIFVWSLDAQQEMLHGIQMLTAPSGNALKPYQFNIAPDYYSKYGVGGDGPYVVETPCFTADAFLHGEWHATTFVNYIRICLKWAGMPGLERAETPPYADISQLTDGFLQV